MNNPRLYCLSQSRVEFFYFFFGGPARKLQAASSQENYFNFLFDLIFNLGYSGLN